MANNDVQNVTDAIKDAQYTNNGTWAQDLDWDPITGTFKVVAHGQGTGDGTAIMPNGFAS